MRGLSGESRITIQRFSTKLSVSAVAGLLDRPHYFAAVSLILSLYSIICLALALALGKPFLHRTSFNYWDEALWLLLVGTALRVVGTAS